MQMFKPGAGRGSFAAKSYWYEAIDHPGAAQMKHLKNLMLSRPYWNWVPRDALIAGEFGERYERLVASAASNFAFVYTYTGRPFTIRMGILTGERLRVWWFDPRTGEASRIGTVANRGEQRFIPPGKPGPGNDWVLVLDDEAAGFSTPGG
jgi:hypothetical protein